MSATKFTGSIAVALAMLASVGLAGPVESGVLAPFGSAALGQVATPINPETASPAKQAMADDLLRRSRQALAENDLAAAESLVGQAEALNVDYGPFHFGDTPKKIRRDLDRRRAGAGPMTGAALAGGKSPAPTDPFARGAAASANSVQPAAGVAPQGTMPQVTRLPSVDAGVDGSLRPGMPMNRTAPPLGTAPVAGATAATSNQMLMDARRALAYGDSRRAGGLLDQAKAIQVARGPYDDSPEAFELSLRKYNELMAVPAERRTSEAFRREYAKLMVEQADGLIRRGDLDEAERLAGIAQRQQVMFGALEAKPETILERVAAARRQGGQFVSPAGGEMPAGAQVASRAMYNPANDPTRNIAASNLQAVPAGQPLPVPTPAGQPMPVAPGQPGGDPASVGQTLFEQGEAALKAHDRDAAVRLFREAAAYRDQLDPMTAQRLQDHLQLLSVPPARPANTAGNMAGETAAKQQLLIKQVQAELIQEESSAKALMSNDPRKAVGMMENARKKVESAGLEPTTRDQLLRRIDRVLTDMRQYIKENQPNLDLDERNARVREEVANRQKTKLNNQEKLAELVNEFNKLMDEQRYAEAQVLAKRAAELDPQNPVVVQLNYQAKFVERHMQNMNIAAEKEAGFVAAMQNVDKSGIPFDDNRPYQHGSVKEWEQLTRSRARLLAQQSRHQSERDIEIQRKLKTQVSLQFENVPLAKVIEYLGKLTEVNVHLDPQGLADSGVTSDTPVTIKLGQEVSLKSALNLILQPLHLTYVVKDEVLKVTSDQQRDGEVYTVTYNVADLVVPIPNFVPSPDMGLAGSLRTAMHNVGFGNNGSFNGGSVPMAVVASRDGAKAGGGAINPAVLAQMPATGAGAQNGNAPMGANGPGGMGGGSQADFDSLIELITATVKPTSWDSVGGPGSIKGFETNLSLVVSQTQEVHQEIVDLLEQLRRLQDLQVTIEVRFITLNDNFFERIGLDFDFDINDNADRPFQIFGRENPGTPTTYGSATATDGSNPRDYLDRDLRRNQSATVGMQAPGQFSADLDIPMRQGSFQVAVPQFGGFDGATNAGAQLGFAILSDIEAYFFLAAATRDRRSNVLQAPKVTLFNGQQAFVSDTSQSPFVISVIPVVGDFAAAQQPVIVVLSEGTFLTVQAVISNDRRFVRLTVVPFFSKIGDVNTFTFQGKETTTTNTSTEGKQQDPNDSTKAASSSTTSREGTTVQLPTFSFVTVTTTVSVPDGGTVLLGGIKRLSEGRDEAGVPLLNKIPYVNRLFKNVGIGRTTQSLMMMVTPRIIIQEEEEDKIGAQP